MPENKTTFLLQHDTARSSTSLETVKHIAKFGWTVVQHSPYSQDLTPSDFRLFGPMKKQLCMQHFSDDTIIAAVRK
jgi:histone-lysine N-methyltransferase SETMAR